MTSPFHRVILFPMRSYYKKQCLEILAVLMDAHKGIAALMESGNAAEVPELLTGCQQAAIAAGELLDNALGEGSAQTGMLEEYCELVFKTYNALAEGKLMHGVTLTLDAPVERVIKSIKALPEEKEIVFLPYKAAMWDSLESEWKKVSGDPSCRAVVIPIPYYDKLPGGGTGSVHYEADKYPEYVPVTDYKSYDLEKNHPDKIFIHNPYDANNNVTSVFPEYYSDKLKNYTDDLVYIPYYVLNEPDPDDVNVQEGLKIYVLTPAVFNAHHVIVQSEAMRKLYINVLSKFSGEDTRHIWEEKISGSGSPKIDRVENLKDEDYELPKEWERMLFKPDGSRRKLILYNTGLSALLKERENMTAKIRRNLDYFRSVKEDVILLWRPHPMIDASLPFMPPEVADAYTELRDSYIKEGFGIYDDSALLDRAIAVSDAYYGDMSSVVWLYQKTGKPIMIQNCYV